MADPRDPEAAPRGPKAPPASPLPLWAAASFLASGAAGLLYEIVWSKQLAYVLGSSLHAVAAVVASFLGGLTIGARVLGVPLARPGGAGAGPGPAESGAVRRGAVVDRRSRRGHPVWDPRRAWMCEQGPA